MIRFYHVLLLSCSLAWVTACGVQDQQSNTTAYTGAYIWTGTEDDPITNGALLVSDGRIIGLFSLDDRELPEHVNEINIGGKFIIPGIINAHGHVGMADGLQTGPGVYSRENVTNQLRLYARYGITTVVSLGDEPPHAFEVRDNMDNVHPGKARLFMSGPVLNPQTMEQAYEQVEARVQTNPDWIKIRVDDQLGRSEKMPEEVFAAIIDASHQHDLPLASHMVTLQDAKGLLEHGTDLLAHSIRDQPVDHELINLMLERDVCITPTLTREVSVFVYAERPDFFDDPFFLKSADPEVLTQLQNPDVQQRYTGRNADFYREALPLAKQNMITLHEAGVRIAMGTDSGPPARFQGYFEHMEMAMMQDAGMSPRDILISATRNAAGCMLPNKNLGTLEPGNHADFLILNENPLDDINNLREIEEIYIGGNPINPSSKKDTD